jgi:uncharacterized membrane protein
VERFFSLFPQAAISFGLLLLRISVALAVNLDAHGQFAASRPDWTIATLWVCSVALVAGFLTPLFAGVSAVLALTFLGATDSLAPVVRAAAAVALALLGPGAYSVDARLFGPRTVVMTVRREPDDRE